MGEPVSTTGAAAAAGAAGWKAIGGAAGVAAGGAGLAAIVVMLMTPPRSAREWAVGLISTVVCSVAGGAWLLAKLGFSDLASQGPIGLAVLFGLCFACGLPGWALVRWVFTWIIARRDATLPEVMHDIRDMRGGGQ